MLLSFSERLILSNSSIRSLAAGLLPSALLDPSLDSKRLISARIS
jgi:hypothetical protein